MRPPQPSGPKRRLIQFIEPRLLLAGARLA
jgi:hypothetical protein